MERFLQIEKEILMRTQTRKSASRPLGLAVCTEKTCDLTMIANFAVNQKDKIFHIMWIWNIWYFMYQKVMTDKRLSDLIGWIKNVIHVCVTNETIAYRCKCNHCIVHFYGIILYYVSLNTNMIKNIGNLLINLVISNIFESNKIRVHNEFSICCKRLASRIWWWYIIVICCSWRLETYY